MLKYYLATLQCNFTTFSFLFQVFSFAVFRWLLSKTKIFKTFINLVSFLLYMYILTLKMLYNLYGCLKVS